MYNPADDEPTSEHLLDVNEVARFIGVSTKTIRSWVARRAFPSPLRPGGFNGQPGKLARWPISVVRAWVESDPGMWCDVEPDDEINIIGRFDTPDEFA